MASANIPPVAAALGHYVNTYVSNYARAYGDDIGAALATITDSTTEANGVT